jgi:long-chain acyl-CoA synthetase
MNNYPTLVDKIYELKETLPNDIYLRQPYGDLWVEFTFDQVITKALQLVSAMKAKGLKKGDHVGIYSKNCFQWIIAEFAIMLGGFIMVPYYANLVGNSLKQVIALSDIKFLFVGKLDNWEQAKESIPKDLPIVKFSHYEGFAAVDKGTELKEFIEGFAPDQKNFRPDPKDIWAIFFTSGTTGVPKGVVMPYSSPANLVAGQVKNFNTFNLSNPGRNTFLSYLPLNHIAEQLLFVGGIYNKGQISFVESLESFSKNLSDVQPTIFLAVPRIWTKFRQGVLAKIPQKKLNILFKIPIVSRLIKNKIKKSLGLLNPKLVGSGASALSADTIEWFQKIGIYIQEAYGLTETMGVVVFDPSEDMRLGRTGRRLEEGQLRIDSETEEILVKNEWMFTGYYNEPELTKECFTGDGFYKTGDTGVLDKDDYLIVKGRVKDTFKTNKGQFIVPIPIEDLFTGNSLIEMLCLVGLRLPQPILLVQLSELTKGLNEKQIESSLLQTLEEANRNLQRYQVIHKIICLKEEWSIANGILTPTLKIKRNVIHNIFSNNYEAWYNKESKIIIL